MRRFTRVAPAVLAAAITLGSCGDDDGADVRNHEGDAGTGTGTESGTGTS